MKTEKYTETPRYKIGEVVCAVNSLNKVEDEPITGVIRSTGTYKGWLYRVGGYSFTEYEIYKDKKMFTAMSAVTDLFNAHQIYTNCIADIQEMCTQKTNALYELTKDNWKDVGNDTREFVIDNLSISLMMYSDNTGDSMERTTFTELLISRVQCDEYEIYIDWYVKVNGVWMSVFDNFEDIVYITIANLLDQAISNWISKQM